MFHSPEVLEVHSVVAGAVSGRLVGHAELRDEPWVARALTLKQTPVSVPLHNLPIIIITTITINIEYHHHLLQHGGEEPPVSARLVLCAASHGVGDVTKDSIVVHQSGKVRCLQHVDDVDKLGGVCGVAATKRFKMRVNLHQG